MKALFLALGILMALQAKAAVTADTLTSKVMRNDAIIYDGQTPNGANCSASVRKSAENLIADVDETVAKVPLATDSQFTSINRDKHQGDFYFNRGGKQITLGLTAGRITKVVIGSGYSASTCQNLVVKGTANMPTVQTFLSGFSGSNAVK